jgi:hypothetical protein
MSTHRKIPRLEDDRIELGATGGRVFSISLIVGVVGMAAALVFGLRDGDGLVRFGHAYQVAYAWYLSLSLGALFFVAIQHVTRASWSVVVRRLAEVMAANLIWLALLSIPMLLLAPKLLPWASGHGHITPELLEHKRPYLNLTFFYIRWVAYFVVWTGYALWFWRRSVQQDETGDPQISLSMERKSGLALMLYAVTVTLASYDILMSMDPSWFSTMFGPYFFAGGVVAFYAVLTVLTFWLQGQGFVQRVIHEEHLHDYGKLMFAFVFFWAYLAFSQYMLIWYANIPEETAWFLRRQENGWEWFGLALVFGHWLLPFAGLISRFAKRSRSLLLFWAVWILAMHWVDLYWVVMPEVQPTNPAPHLIDLLCMVGLGGLWVAGLAFLAKGRSLVPKRDPRLQDSLGFENA